MMTPGAPSIRWIISCGAAGTELVLTKKMCEILSLPSIPSESENPEANL